MVIRWYIVLMKALSFDKLASVEGGIPCASPYTGTYCPLAFLVLASAFKSHSIFALFAGVALKKALCTPCGGDFTVGT